MKITIQAVHGIPGIPEIHELPLTGTVAAVTGHRPDKLWNDYDLTSEKMRILERLLTCHINEIKPDYMISGMALGTDTLWAHAAIINNIPLIAAIPFDLQDIRWSNYDRALYRQLLSHAYAVVNVSGEYGYKPEYMQLRNQWMVDQLVPNPASRLVAVFDGSAGGTQNCVDYAHTVLKPEKITIINPQLL
jgi:uncharacterized phage-like protein YoqJ